MVDVAKILRESLTIRSELVDPSPFVVSIPDPNPGAKNNVDRLPSLFIWLLNMFSKNIVTQLATEANGDTRSAEPLGLTVAKIFSTPDFYWRGNSLIDILIAKITKECPVLFGGRGDAKMQGGRAMLGWRKVQGEYVLEQEHLERMTGIGAGYAAISLRNFSRSQSTSPWPPYHYWQSMATIVSTPPEHITATHCTVLKAMIENFEVKFMQFYGDAARAALRVALLDFPGRAIDQHDAAVRSLTVLADKLEQDYGLALGKL
jgi:nucleoporin GLE1